MLWHYIYPVKGEHRCGTCGKPADVTIVWADPRGRDTHVTYSHSCHFHLEQVLDLIHALQQVP